MWGVAAILFLTSPLWLFILRMLAISRAARVLLLVMALATGVILALMFMLGANCGPAQDLTYTPEMCPTLPAFFVNLVTLPMILGIMLLPFLNIAGLIAAAGFEVVARMKRQRA